MVKHIQTLGGGLHEPFSVSSRMRRDPPPMTSTSISSTVLEKTYELKANSKLGTSPSCGSDRSISASGGTAAVVIFSPPVMQSTPQIGRTRLGPCR